MDLVVFSFFARSHTALAYCNTAQSFSLEHLAQDLATDHSILRTTTFAIAENFLLQPSLTPLQCSPLHSIRSTLVRVCLLIPTFDIRVQGLCSLDVLVSHPCSKLRGAISGHPLKGRTVVVQLLRQQVDVARLAHQLIDSEYWRILNLKRFKIVRSKSQHEASWNE